MTMAGRVFILFLEYGQYSIFGIRFSVFGIRSEYGQNTAGIRPEYGLDKNTTQNG